MSEVKLLVNKLPVTPSECPFFKVNYLYLDAKCAILDNACELCHSSGCSKLMSYDEYAMERTMEAVKKFAEMPLVNPISAEELRQAFKAEYKSGTFHHRYGEKVIQPRM